MKSINLYREDAGNRTISLAILASLIIHWLLLSNLGLNQKTKFNPPIEVEFIKEVISKKQIVSKPEVQSEKIIETNFRSDKNSFTEKQQIKRGLPGSEQQKVTLFKKEISQPKLKLDNKTLEKKFSKVTPTKEHGIKREKKLEDYKPFTKNYPQTSFSSRIGSADFLPQIQDGEITLLNTKADRYAVFVRRVALRVFGSLRRLNWQNLPLREVYKIKKMSTIKAVLSKEGKLLSVKLLESSGSDSFDQILLEAANLSTWDQNPPIESAAKDGNIHFIFKSKSWGRPGIERISEQRWLLLSTGLL